MNELPTIDELERAGRVPYPRESQGFVDWTNGAIRMREIAEEYISRGSPSPEHRNEVLELVVEKLQEARPYMMSTAGFTQKVVGFIEGIDKALAVVASLKSETKP